MNSLKRTSLSSTNPMSPPVAFGHHEHKIPVSDTMGTVDPRNTEADPLSPPETPNLQFPLPDKAPRAQGERFVLAPLSAHELARVQSINNSSVSAIRNLTPESYLVDSAYRIAPRSSEPSTSHHATPSSAPRSSLVGTDATLEEPLVETAVARPEILVQAATPISKKRSAKSTISKKVVAKSVLINTSNWAKSYPDIPELGLSVPKGRAEFFVRFAELRAQQEARKGATIRERQILKEAILQTGRSVTMEEALLARQLASLPFGGLRSRKAKTTAQKKKEETAHAASGQTSGHGYTAPSRANRPTVTAKTTAVSLVKHSSRVSKPTLKAQEARDLFFDDGEITSSPESEHVTVVVDTKPTKPAARKPKTSATARPKLTVRKPASTGKASTGGASPSSDSPKSKTNPRPSDKEFDKLPDYAPPLPSGRLHFRVTYTGSPFNLANDPHRQLLHPDELQLASLLRLDCATYLTTKRRIFGGRRASYLKQAVFRKTHAQKACFIDVNKASKLWEAYDNVGWFDEKYVPYLKL